MTCKCCDSVSSNQSRCFCWATIPWTSWLRPARGTIKTIIKPWPAKAIQYFAKHVWNWGGVTRPPTNSILQPISVCSFWMRLLRSDWSTGDDKLGMRRKSRATKVWPSQFQSCSRKLLSQVKKVENRKASQLFWTKATVVRQATLQTFWPLRRSCLNGRLQLFSTKGDPFTTKPGNNSQQNTVAISNGCLFPTAKSTCSHGLWWFRGFDE